MRKTSKIALSIATGFGLSLFTPVALTQFSQPSFRYAAIEVAFAAPKDEVTCSNLQKCLDDLKGTYGEFAKLYPAYLTALQQLAQVPLPSPPPTPQHKELYAVLKKIKAQADSLVNAQGVSEPTLTAAKTVQTITTEMADVFKPLEISATSGAVKWEEIQDKLNELGDKSVPPESRGKYDDKTYEAIRAFLQKKDGELEVPLNQLKSATPPPSPSPRPSPSPSDGNINIGKWSFSPWWLSLLAVPVIGFLVWKFVEANKKRAEETDPRGTNLQPLYGRDNDRFPSKDFSSEYASEPNDRGQTIVVSNRKIKDLESKITQLENRITTILQQSSNTQQTTKIKELEERIFELEQNRQAPKSGFTPSRTPSYSPTQIIHDNRSQDRDPLPPRPTHRSPFRTLQFILTLPTKPHHCHRCRNPKEFGRSPPRSKQTPHHGTRPQRRILDHSRPQSQRSSMPRSHQKRPTQYTQL
jgi:hypothetical protein